MRLKKILSAAFIIFIAFTGHADFNACAEDNTGLITKCSLSCEQSENGIIKISAKTQASGMMSEIGFEDITIQYSDDGINWHNEKNIGSMTKYNANHYCVDGITAEISGGHLYRVACTHTATGNLFMGEDTFTQTAVHFSKYISVEKITETSETLTAQHYDISTTVSTVSTVSTTSVSTTSALASTNFSTVSTSTATMTAANSQQESTVSENNSDNSNNSFTNRIYEYFGGNSPVTGAGAPTAAVVLLALSAAAAIKFKKK
ncbi:MAG: hypothetical protein IJ666_00395 [Ruminococcus sp.]|nr:hypothetical protein [Ruminococcus sp.]